MVGGGEWTHPPQTGMCPWLVVMDKPTSNRDVSMVGGGEWTHPPLTGMYPCLVGISGHTHL